jgi:serine/threonine protein kinase
MPIAGGGLDAPATDANGKEVRLWVGAPGRTVAPDGSGPGELLARLSRVYHVGLPRVLDSCVIDDRAVLVLQPYRGRPLAERLAEVPPIDTLEAIDRVRSAAAALVKAHRAGLTHGALDEREVLLADDGRTLVLHLGFSAFLGPRPPRAPEDLETPGSETSDVFGLSRILVRCLEGQDPIRDTADLGALVERSAESFPAGLPEGLRRLLARAIHPDPERRLCRAEELTGDLAVIRASWGSSAAQEPAPPVPLALLAHPVILAGAALVLLVALALLFRAC